MTEERRENPANQETHPLTRGEVRQVIERINEGSDRSFREYIESLRAGKRTLANLEKKDVDKLKKKEKWKAKIITREEKRKAEESKDWFEKPTAEEIKKEAQLDEELGEVLGKDKNEDDPFRGLSDEEISRRLAKIWIKETEKDGVKEEEIDGLPHPPVNNQKEPMERDSKRHLIMETEPDIALIDVDKKDFDAVEERRRRRNERGAKQMMGMLAHEKTRLENDSGSNQPREMETRYQQASERTNQEEKRRVGKRSLLIDEIERLKKEQEREQERPVSRLKKMTNAGQTMEESRKKMGL